MSIILHILCRNIDCSKGGTAPLKGELDIWKCTLLSFKGHGATFQGILHICCLDIVPAKTHCIAPKKDYSCSAGYVCFEYCVCQQVWGCCNYDEVIQHILQKLCFVDGTCSSIYQRQSEHLDTSSSNTCSSGHAHSFFCSLGFSR